MAADTLNGIFISEILADNAGGSAIDTDGDGSTNKADEFIELQNASGGTISLDGYQIWSQQDGLLYSFANGETLGPGETATVVGNHASGDGNGFYDAGVSENTNWLQDGEGQKFDSIFLVNSLTGEYIVLSYGNPPPTPVLPTGFPGTTQLGAGEAIDSNAPNGTAFARDINGDLIETSPTPDQPNLFCFLVGTQIMTEDGEARIEDLTPGTRIHTLDHGLLPLRALGHFTPSMRDIWRNPDLVPVVLPVGCMGNDRVLSLSGAHRIITGGHMTELLFGETEVLVSARHLVGHQGAHVAALTPAPEYYHLVFDAHEIICANGCWAESMFLTGPETVIAYDMTVWTYQHGVDLGDLKHDQTARMMLKKSEAQLLLHLERATGKTRTTLHQRAA